MARALSAREHLKGRGGGGERLKGNMAFLRDKVRSPPHLAATGFTDTVHLNDLY
eukprot:CAMPEP_0180134910 /NCGR_PEP_ID=MMETSP0986-20121125/10470_1 /TAXON_ID=697907 /ORGANISM="non described non described, Strain CCMP2293" /LENGTH=53 /DNA_ID=CAMNT_0022075415 /DNA_START=93 /DNA_END=252 /DNA_ORIENTATION=+